MRTRPASGHMDLAPDVGWQLAVRRTVAGPAPDLWRRLLGEWLPTWLAVDSVPQMVGAPLRRDERVCGRVIGCHVGRRVRVRWIPPELDHETVFQVTLTGSAAGTEIAVHQDGLPGRAERQAQLTRWSEILDGLPGGVAGSTSAPEQR